MAKFCKDCGSPLVDGAKFCRSCGATVEQADQPAAQESPRQGSYAQPQQQQPPQGGYTPRPNVYIPEEFLRKNAARKGQVYGQPQQPQYQQTAAPQQPQYQQPAAQQQPQYARGGMAPKPKKRRSWIIVATALFLAAVFLFTAFVAPGFLRGGDESSQGGGTSGGGNTSEHTKPAAEKTENGSVSKESPKATLCGVTLDVVPEMLEGGTKQVAVSKLAETTEDGVRCENYELDMGTHEKFEVPIEVTFPCKISAGYDPTVEHYNEETGNWDPLISFVDEAKGTVTAYFGSFSEARVSYLPVGVDPKIYRVVENKSNKYAPEIALAANYWKILQRINPEQYSDEVTKFINDPSNYAIDFPELDPNMDAKAAYEAFTKTNTIWTFIDPLINLGINELPEQGQCEVVKFFAKNSETISNYMSAVPFIMMSAQVALDLSSGEPDAEKTAAVNLYKNLIASSGTIYSLTTGYSHIGFTLAFFGVALFGMELDYFVDAAKAEQKANVKSVFDSYYTNTVPFDSFHWYKVFEDAYWDNDGNAEMAMRAVKEAVDAYCNRFWTDVYENEGSDEFWEALSDSEYRKVFTNATAEDKAALTEQQKARVWNLIQKHSMKIIRRFLLEQLQTDTGKQLSKVVDMYNREKTITVRENVNRDAEAQLTGYTVCLGYDNVPYPDWHVNIPEEGYENGWQVDFNCTVYGYLKAGMPYQFLFYPDEEDFNEAVKTKGRERPSYIYAFKLDPQSKDPNTIVEINFGDPYRAKSDSFTGYSWKSLDYGGTIHNSYVNEAIEDAIRKASFKLDKDGNFSVSSSGSSSKSGTGLVGPNDSYSYNASASVSLKGHIDRSTGDGTFEVSISVSYNSRWSDPYDGTDTVSASVTIKGGGDIDGEIDGEGMFDPVFDGPVTVRRHGTASHQKGKPDWDKDSTDTIDRTEEQFCKIIFLSDN